MNQQFQEEFIRIYESEISIWKIKRSEYHDRTKKDVGYTKLVNKLREVEPNATKETVIKKINNYRSAFRKEQKKIKESMKSGAGADAVCTPKLWYFKLLSFLGDQDTPRTSITNLDADDGGDDDNDVENVDPAVEDQETPVVQEENSCQSTATSASTPRTRRRQRSSFPETEQESLANEVLQTVKEHYKRPRYQEDRFDVIGKSVAIKLRGLPKQQMLIADKLINDTLFQAEMGCLNLSHRLVGEATYQQYPHQFGQYFPQGNVPVARQTLSAIPHQERPHTSSSSSPVIVRAERYSQHQEFGSDDSQTAGSFLSCFSENS